MSTKIYRSTLDGLSLEWGRAITTIVIPRNFIDLVCDLSRAYGKELAGFGIGMVEHETIYVEDLVLGENLSENSDRFYLDPAAMLETFKYSELGGREVVALVHTHRAGTFPSALDVEGMKLWPIPWVIIEEAGCSIRAWVLSREGLKELPVKVVST